MHKACIAKPTMECALLCPDTVGTDWPAGIPL